MVLGGATIVYVLARRFSSKEVLQTRVQFFIDILLVTLGGAILFGERLTPPRVAAISLIAVGVLLVGWGGQ